MTSQEYQAEVDVLIPMKKLALEKVREAEKAMYDYFCVCPIGPERERAHEVYERIRTSTRIV